MDIIEDLKPFEKELNLYKSHNALPQGEVKGALADIYEKYYPQNRHWGVSKPNRGCPSCVSDFMKCLVSEWNNRPTVEFKGVPQEVENGFNSMVEPDALSTELEDDIHEWDDNVEAMKWGEFKTYCKEQGLKVHGKTKKQLLQELGL